MRLQKYLACCGIASRRKSEQLISDGRVKVNGIVINEMGVDVDPDYDRVEFDGKRVLPEKKKDYIMFYKPVGVVTTMNDPQNRVTVASYFKNKISDRVYPVGRLDYNTEGLLLMTNDGDLTYKLTHPKNEVNKTYNVVLNGCPAFEDIKKLENGVLIDGKKTSKAKIVLSKNFIKNKSLFITIHEGRNREIRKLFESINYKIIFLKRTMIGDLNLDLKKPGQWRYLTKEEVKYLFSL